MGKSEKKLKSKRVAELRKKYETYLEEEKRRKERNELIIDKFRKVQNHWLTLTTSVPTVRENDLWLTNKNKSRVELLSELSKIQNQTLSLIEPLKLVQVKDIKTQFLSELSKQYTLVPKQNHSEFDMVTNKNEESCLLPTKENPDDWKSKYDILHKLKSNEVDNKIPERMNQIHLDSKIAGISGRDTSAICKENNQEVDIIDASPINVSGVVSNAEPENNKSNYITMGFNPKSHFLSENNAHEAACIASEDKVVLYEHNMQLPPTMISAKLITENKQLQPTVTEPDRSNLYESIVPDNKIRTHIRYFVNPQQNNCLTKQLNTTPHQEYVLLPKQHEIPQQQYEISGPLYETSQLQHALPQQHDETPQLQNTTPQQHFETSQPQHTIPREQHSTHKQKYITASQEYIISQQEFTASQEDNTEYVTQQIENPMQHVENQASQKKIITKQENFEYEQQGYDTKSQIFIQNNIVPSQQVNDSQPIVKETQQINTELNDKNYKIESIPQLITSNNDTVQDKLIKNVNKNSEIAVVTMNITIPDSDNKQISNDEKDMKNTAEHKKEEVLETGQPSEEKNETEPQSKQPEGKPTNQTDEEVCNQIEAFNKENTDMFYSEKTNIANDNDSQYTQQVYTPAYMHDYDMTQEQPNMHNLVQNIEDQELNQTYDPHYEQQYAPSYENQQYQQDQYENNQQEVYENQAVYDQQQEAYSEDKLYDQPQQVYSEDKLYDQQQQAYNEQGAYDHQQVEYVDEQIAYQTYEQPEGTYDQQQPPHPEQYAVEQLVYEQQVYEGPQDMYEQSEHVNEEGKTYAADDFYNIEQAQEHGQDDSKEKK